MALKLNEKYPGYMNAPSVDYPQGSFKNRTSPTSEDGSYFEQDWANDQQGFFQSLIASAGETPNGNVDRVGSSQYFDALKKVIQGSSATEILPGVAKVATSLILQAGVNNDSFATAKGLKDAGLWPLGEGQSWQNVTASRASGVNYTNTSGRAIYCTIAVTGNDAGCRLIVDGLLVDMNDVNSSAGGTFSAGGIVPRGSTYKAETSGGTLSTWMELR